MGDFYLEKQYTPTIPGSSNKLTGTYARVANNAQQIVNLLPYLSNTINQQLTPTALSQLQASQATSPGYAQLMTDLFSQYGPQLNAIGNQISRQNMSAQAANELNNLITYGPAYTNVALALSKAIDQPFYTTRDNTSNSIAQLLNSIDLSGALSGTERSEIAQGLARSAAQRGTLNAPSPIDTIADAMQYGQAAYNRQNTQKSLLSDAIQKASNFLPNSRSGINIFDSATGKNTGTNVGQSLFTGVSKPTDASSNNILSGLLGTGTTYTQQLMQNTANEKDWMDYGVQGTQGFKNVASGAGSIAGMVGGKGMGGG